MTSIETYQEQIATIKASIETLKGDKPLVINNLPGRAPLRVCKWDDFNFPVGTVIAGNGDHVYLRVPHGDTYWASSSRDITEPDGYDLEQFYNFLCRNAAEGEQFRIVYQPSA